MDIKAKGEDCQGVDLLLPWYVSGSLSEEEKERVKEHLKGCERCRRELELIRKERELYREIMDEIPAPATFPRLLAEIERAERGNLWQRFRSLIKAIGDWPRPALVLAAVQALLILGLITTLSLNPWGMGNRVYRTLAGPEVISPRGPCLQVVFQEDATEGAIRELLLEIGGKIVAGPTPMGVYLIELPEGLDRQQIKGIVSSLREKKEIVKFVEMKEG